MKGSNRSFTFKAHNEDITKEWINEIKKHIVDSKGKQKRNSVMGTTLFWKV